MMKRSLMTLVVILAIVSTCVSVASAEEFPVLDKQVETRQAHLKWITTIQETSMDAVIAYIDEISNGTGTSELESLRDEFQAQTAAIETLTTHVALNNALRQLRQITTDFRLETRKQMNGHNGKYLELLRRTKTALDEHKGELDNLRDTYWEERKDNALEIFDIRVDRAQNVINTLRDKGYDSGEAQGKLDEIKAKRSDLEDAFNEKDNLAIAQVHRDIFDLSKELARIVRDLQVEIPRERIVKHWITVGERVVERTATIISGLDRLEIDVTELQDIHSQAENDLEKAKEAFDAGDLEAAIDALKDLKTDLIELRDAYEELVFGGELSGDLKATVESTSAVLSDAIEEMEASM
jgi:hypothetical protein